MLLMGFNPNHTLVSKIWGKVIKIQDHTLSENVVFCYQLLCGELVMLSHCQSVSLSVFLSE